MFVVYAILTEAEYL